MQELFEIRFHSNQHLLQTLQVENVRLTQENRRMNQLEADRLRFEQASRDTWEEVTRLKEVNDRVLLAIEVHTIIINNSKRIRRQKLSAQCNVTFPFFCKAAVQRNITYQRNAHGMVQQFDWRGRCCRYIFVFEAIYIFKVIRLIFFE